MASAEGTQNAAVATEEYVNKVADKTAGAAVKRYFTIPGRDPFEELEWELRDAFIAGKDKPTFEQKSVEFPKFWSQTATNIVAQKYFRGRMSSPERERSVKEMIGRVVDTIAGWGRDGGYFATEEEAETFEAELKFILVNQLAAFNSPVWFNVGFEDRPQCSACFINSFKDDMRSIMQLAMTEGMLFKYGSGTGSNLSALRSSKEHLSTGGKASGPVSFMKGYDAFAGVIKSGGRTRRAAKMVILNADHPDVVEFIWSKANEEKKAWALIDAGYDGAVDGEAYGSVFFQNANHSVRVTDDFMHAVTDNKEWQTHYITNHKVADTYKARDLMRQMAEAAYICGDPGIQFDTTVNEWNPCSNTGRINASNPCSEYMFLDDSACNLASLNLMKFRTPEGEFDVDSFKHAVEIVITAQEILVDNASYPTPGIEKNSHDYRPLGMGYANLGALLMSRGLAYDSDKGRNLSAAISALMSGQAYATSSLVAKRLGPFRGYPSNEKPFLNVIGMHRSHAGKIPREDVPKDLVDAAVRSWDEAL